MVIVGLQIDLAIVDGFFGRLWGQELWFDESWVVALVIRMEC